MANPPYSVSAFKNHLELKNNKLELFDYVSKDGKEIETLFVERIAQLLKPNGIAAVVLPSSILSNSSTSYIKAREVLLKNFELKSIVQFGSKTFGATGTNTVVLYLKKNGEPPVKSKMIYDNVSAIFTNENLRVVSDKEIFENYCSHIKVSKEDYIQFLKDSRENNPYENYGENKNYFSMYVSDFEQSPEYKTAQKQDEKQKTNLNTIKAFYNYVLKIEKDKVYYFALVYNQNVLVVTSPSDNAEQEKFLGYTWSNRKGDEGIKLKEDSKIKCGVLYNTNDEENSLACYVKDSFLGIYRNEGTLQKYINSFSLSDMLDFTRTTFDKAICTNVQSEKVKIESKWPLVKLGEICKIINPSKTAIHDILDDTVVSFVDMASISNDGYIELKTDKFLGDLRKGSYSYFAENDIIIAKITPCMENGKCAIARKLTNGIGMGSSEFHVFRIDNKYSTEYVFAFLNRKKIRDEAEKVMTGSSGHRRVPVNFYKDLLLPLPPLDIQQNIVDECEAVDKEYEEAQDAIVQCKNEISSIMKNVKGEEKKLGEICKVINPSKTDIRDIPDDTVVSFVEMSSISNDGGIEVKIDKNLGDLRKGSYTYFSENDIIIAKITPCMENGKCAIAKQLTNKLGMGSSEFHVFRIKDDYSTEFVFTFLNRKQIREEAEKVMTGSSGHRRVPINFYKDLSIPVPPLAEQQRIVEQITALEQQIAAAKKIIADVPAKKQAILDRWL